MLAWIISIDECAHDDSLDLGRQSSGGLLVNDGRAEQAPDDRVNTDMTPLYLYNYSYSQGL
jgi:hypothetical protein